MANNYSALLISLPALLLPSKSFAHSCSSGTTDDIEACRYRHVKTSEETLEKYITAASKRLTQKGKTRALATFYSGQKNWSLYRSQECDSVALFFQPGTIADLMKIDCLQKLTDVRMHEVWNNWLRYMDSTLPILPEPSH